ncbi:hypothetical protein FQA47_009189, partial [Oryzias melastigma]
EHYYNAEDGSGYLAWRLKFVQKEASNGQKKAGRLSRTLTGGPIADRGCFREEDSQMTDSLRSEAIALMKHTADEGTVKRKMKQTFNYRQQMIHDPVKSSDIFLEFPRFLDVEGLIEQDFTLMFDEAISAKFLEKWPTIFKQKVLEQSRGLTQSDDLQYLLQNAQGPTEVENGKMKLITRRMLYDYLYKLVGISICISTGTSIQGFLDGITESLQPFLLAVGTQKSVVHKYFIVIDKHAIPSGDLGVAASLGDEGAVHGAGGKGGSDPQVSSAISVPPWVYSCEDSLTDPTLDADLEMGMLAWAQRKKRTSSRQQKSKKKS